MAILTSELRELCEDLPRMQERLFRAGLIKTAQAMTPAILAIGFETAEIIVAREEPDA